MDPKTRRNDSPELTQPPSSLVELLYFEGCPSYERLLPRLQDLIVEAGLTERVELRRVRSEQDAAEARFLGSPTVRIAGKDVEPGSEARRDYGLKCRLYPATDGLSGLPRDEWILDALPEAGTPGA